jgi:hypothetical protein
MKTNEEYRRNAYELTKDKIFNILIVLIVFSFLTGIFSSLSSSFGPTYDLTVFPFVETNPGNPGLVQLFNFIGIIISSYVAYSVLIMFIDITHNQQPVRICRR